MKCMERRVEKSLTKNAPLQRERLAALIVLFPGDAMITSLSPMVLQQLKYQG